MFWISFYSSKNWSILWYSRCISFWLNLFLITRAQTVFYCSSNICVQYLYQKFATKCTDAWHSSSFFFFFFVGYPSSPHIIYAKYIFKRQKMAWNITLVGIKCAKWLSWKTELKKKIIILMGIYIKSYNKHIAFEKKHLILVKSKDSNNNLFFHRV